MQNRVSNLHQILREMIDRAEASRLSRGIGAAALTAVLLSFVTIGAGWATAEKSKRLSGSQIRAKFIGMQLTDEVHWRDVYERDGTLRSYSMGRKQIGKWRVEKDELCLMMRIADSAASNTNWPPLIEPRFSGSGGGDCCKIAPVSTALKRD